MANEQKKGLSTNSNAYTLIYAAVLVIVVAFLLSFISSSLKDRQDANEMLDKKAQILAVPGSKISSGTCRRIQDTPCLLHDTERKPAEKDAVADRHSM